MLLSTALFPLFFLGCASAVFVNRTIDDQYGDPMTGQMPVYFPADQWSQGADCPGCLAKPAANMAFDGTWHDSTYFATNEIRSITISFTGSAIYVFFITGHDTQETHLNITLDGQPVGVFNFVPRPGDFYQYNQSVYSNQNIPMGSHTLVMSSGGVSSSLLLFDYAIYTIDDTVQSSSPSATGTASKIAIGPIIGGVLGGTVVILVIALFVRKAYQAKKATQREEVQVGEVKRKEEAKRIGAFARAENTAVHSSTFNDAQVINKDSINLNVTVNRSAPS